MIIWIDGKLQDLAAARVSPLDRGLTVGDGVFETMRVYGGVPFAFRRHVERLAYSATGLGLPLPELGALREAIGAVLDANGLRDARVRITVTGGEGPPGSSRAGAEPVTIIVAVPFAHSDSLARVVIAPWTRNEQSATAGLKTISYASNVRALAYAEERGANECIFANTAGGLCEATGSNVFVVEGGVLRTPPPEAGCLLGVTRALILELAATLGIAHEEVHMPIRALAAADEAFLSSTTREVQAISHVDGVALPVAPGPVSVQLQAAFRDLVTTDLDP